MGLYQSIYIGPYLSVSKKTIESFKSEVVCVSDTCRTTPTNSKFCPDCGEPTQTIQRPVKKNISAFNICNEFSDEMYIPELDTKNDIVLPNNYDGRPFKIRIDGDRGCSSIHSLRSLDRESDVNWLTTKYSHIIDRLKEEFDEVIVDWGIVVSWS